MGRESLGIGIRGIVEEWKPSVVEGGEGEALLGCPAEFIGGNKFQLTRMKMPR